jgi:hypothetical protein
MYHRHVARNIIPSFYGDTSALPSSIIAGSTYGHSFDSWTVPTGVDPTRLRAIVLLIDPSNGHVLNTNGADLFGSVDIEEIDNSLNFEVFPNPSTDKVFIKVNFDLADDAKITLTDLNGKIILDQDLNGENGKRTFEINKTNVSKGIYILSLENNDKTSNKKIVFE